MHNIRQKQKLFIKLHGDGGKELICIGARVKEGLSTIPELRMEFVSRVNHFEPSSILGKPVKLETEQGFEFSGIVISVEDIGLEVGGDVFAAEVRPWFWLTTLGEDNRVFQNLDAMEIVAKVLDEMGFSDITNSVSGSLEKREYCVQYGESNYDFICRLLEEEGIYFFFDYSDKVEKIVFANGLSAHGDAGDIAFTVANIAASSRGERDAIYEWSERGKVSSGKVTLWDYDFELPNSSLIATATKTTGDHANKEIERYVSSGHYKKAEAAESGPAKHLSEAHAADAARATGLTNNAKLRTGIQFKLKYPDRKKLEASYLVVSATHWIRFDDGAEGTEMQRLTRQAEHLEFPEGMALFETEFEVQLSANPFRPRRETPWPEVPSLLTATVVGPKGEEIYTDKYGRIKVQFPWDRDGKMDDQSSCFVRTVMPWTGKGYGFIAVPRIGMEVIIQFERGNIDRPICTGMVYNGANLPPYALPDKMNIVALRTHSTKGGGDDNYHELSFDDTKGSEKTNFQSEKDYVEKIKNNATITIGMETADPGDLKQTIKNSKTENIEEADWTLNVKKGNRIANVKTDDTTTVEGKSTTTITGDTTLEVKTGNYSETIKTGNMTTEVSMGNQSTTVKMGNQTTDVKMGNISVKADLGAVTIEAMQSITLKVGQSSVVIDMMGVTVKGMMISSEAQIMNKVKGVMTQVNGDAMVQIQGGITMIN